MRNKLVIFLPLTVMIGLFVFGYLSVIQTEEVNNEQLDSHTELTIDLKGDEGTVSASWNWDAMPSDGIAGDDYIEIVLFDENEKVLPDAGTEGILELGQRDDVIYTVEETVQTEDGLMMVFPNRTEDNVTYGNRGSLVISFDPGAEVHGAEVRYAHTWVEHEAFTGEGLTEDRIDFTPDIPHWVLRRSTISPDGE
ncbi:hypothetical protein CR205_08565 [Alteribacter lacisalsi]|uniref:Uncharacterized protein n=1 Tax=Alteribacter lacisalsi TaxID=2045244 RepID=A0A2W0HBQ7_9BACI|nr:hypothetical protein [Alteribacter lacisalsi]PYZ98617.1 hypothetical protein CR205_08565 [Alteribacter lacisalsi]